MNDTQKPHDLDDVLDKMAEAGSQAEEVQVDDLVKAVGERSFGPLLVLLALIAFTPLGGIPGLPTVLAAMVILTVGQLLFGARSFWLPKFILHRKIDSGKLKKTISYMRRPAGWIDRLIKPRLRWLLKGYCLRIAALGCIAVSLTVPPLEFVPFGGTPSWLAIGAFGLAVVAEDGLLALIALAFAAGSVFVLYWLLF